MGAGLNFLINIQQKLGGGDVASKLTDLEKKIKGEQQALSDLERQQKQTDKGAKSAGASAGGEVAVYDRVRGAIGAKKTALDSLRGKLTQTAAAGEQGSTSIASFAQNLKASAGPAIALATAVLAVVAAIGVAVYKLASFALGAADVHRSFLLVMQGATGSAAGAAAASGAIDRVAAKSAVARSELARMAQALALAGITGALFESTLQQVANVHSVLGAAAASTYETITKGTRNAFGKLTFQVTRDQLRELGLSMEDLGKKFGMSARQIEQQMLLGKISVEKGVGAMNELLGKKFGKLAESAALSLSVQLMRLKENIAGLFRDINIEPFLAALKDLLSIFDSSTSSGKALKLMLTTIFSGLFAAAAAVLPYVKAFFQGIIIGALQLYVAVKPIFKAIFGGLGGKPSDSLIKAFVMLGKFAVYVMVGLAALVGFLVSTFAPMFAAASAVVGGLVAAVGLVLGVIGALGVGFMALVAKLGEGASAIWARLSTLFAPLSDLDLSSIAANLIDGLVDGLLGGIGRAVAAVQSLGSAVMGGLQNLLGIHSRSTVFYGFGGFTAQGFEEGIEAGAPAAKGAVNKMVDVPKGGAAAGGRRGGARAVQLAENLTLVALDPEELWAMLEAKVVSLFEAAENAGPEGAPA